MLDIDHGTYPYITSSSTTAGGAATGTGVPPTKIHGVLGVAKAYSTRVGGGPFPTEMTGKLAETIRARRKEYGNTTGRPRRCCSGIRAFARASCSARLTGAPLATSAVHDAPDSRPRGDAAPGQAGDSGRPDGARGSRRAYPSSRRCCDAHCSRCERARGHPG